MNNKLIKYSIPIYYIMTWLISGLLLLLHFVFKNSGDYVTFPQFALTIALFLFAALTKQKEIFIGIKSRLGFNKKLFKGLLFAVIVPAVLIIISGLVLSLVSDYKYKPWNTAVIPCIISLIGMLLGCFGEEIGWRGFLLPKFQEKFNPLISSILLGLLWGFWHMNFTYGFLGFILFSVTTAELSILFTGLFNKTGGNVLLMVIFHFMLNLFTHIFLLERLNVKLYIVQILVFGIACIIMIACNKGLYIRKTQLKK